MLIEWKEGYSVGVAEIDKQHKNLIEIVNELSAAMEKNKVRDELAQILEKLVNFSREHFSTEEKYFDEFNYEHAESHKEEHKQFSDKILSLQKQYKDKELEISFDLIDFLEDWWLDHLIEEDQKYIKCFKDNGLS
ncbi:MAG: bacteriohemerythrin [Candidatus Marinimicrobia bacterium]|nr:bacteriohemerythrin [Candidatus Neomarinimicrobiota bacterium]